ncbi:MAG: hypothetical protein U1E27_07695 [Kiritimatiellia bacterium]|nr:hypothetical protein [Kiritimatiellia bacterium]
MKKILSRSGWILLLVPFLVNAEEAGTVTPSDIVPLPSIAQNERGVPPGTPPFRRRSEDAEPRRNRGVEAEGLRRRDPGTDTPEEGSIVERWLHALRERNPEEFERMQRLRDEDPEAFRDAMRERIRKLRNRPRGESEDADPSGHTRRTPGIDREPDAFGINRAELKKVWDNAKTDDDRERIRNRVREQVAKSLIARMEQHERRLAEMERDLHRMRESLARQRAGAEKWIQQRTDQVFQHMDRPPAPPPREQD